MSEEEVKVKVGGDASEAKSALQAVAAALGGLKESFSKWSEEASKSFEHIGHAGEGFKGAMEGLAGAFAFEKINEGFKDVIKEASHAETEARKFVATMKGVGTASNPDKFFELAEALEKTTTYTAEATMAAGSMLARFNLSQKQIEKLIPLTQDLASYMGGDLASSADQMGRAVEIGSAGLRGLNLGFDKAARAAFDMAGQDERVAMIMEKLKQQVGGTAAMMANTGAGAMLQYANATEKAHIALGAILDAPVAAFYNRLTESVRGTTEWFNSLSDGSKNLIAGFASGIAAIAAVAAALATVGGAVTALSMVIPAVTAGLAAVGTFGVWAFGAILAPLLAVAAGILGVILIVGALRQAWNGDLGGMRSFCMDWIRDVKYLWAELVTFVKGVWGDFTEWFNEKFIIMRGLMKGLSADEVGKQLMESKSGDKKNDFGPAIEASFEKGKAIMGRVGSALGEVWDGAKGVFADGITGLKEVAKMLGINLGSFDQHTEKTHEETKQTRKPEFKGLDFSKDGGDMATAIAVMAAMANVSEQNFKKIADSVGGDMQKAVLIASDFGKTAAIVADGTGKMESYWDSAAGQHQLFLANMDAGLAQFGKSLIGNMGAAGGMIKNAMSAMASGGPFAAIASVVMDVLMQSKSFQAIMAILSKILGDLAQAFNPLLNALGPVLQVVSQVVGSIGGILSKIFTDLAPVLAIIGYVMGMVGDMLGTVFDVISGVIDSIMSAIMPIIEAVMPIIKIIAAVLKSLSPLFSLLQLAMLPMILPMTMMANVFKALKPAFDLLFTALKFVGGILLQGAKFIGGIWNGIIDVLAGVLDAVAQAIPWLQGMGDELKKNKLDLSKFDSNAKDLAGTTSDVTKGFDQLKPPLQAAGQELSNVPSIIKVTRLRFEAAMGDSSVGYADTTSTSFKGPTGAAKDAVASKSTDQSRNVHIDSMTVNGGTAGAAAADAMKKALESDRYRLTGSTEASPVPNASPRTAGAH